MVKGNEFVVKIRANAFAISFGNNTKDSSEMSGDLISSSNARFMRVFCISTI